MEKLNSVQKSNCESLARATPAFAEVHVLYAAINGRNSVFHYLSTWHLVIFMYEVWPFKRSQEHLYTALIFSPILFMRYNLYIIKCTDLK